MCVSFAFEQFYDFLLEFALNYYFSIFDCTPYPAFGFQQFAKFLQVGFSTGEAGNDGYAFAAAVVPLYAHTQFLRALGECLLFGRLVCVLHKVGVGGIYYVQSLFPVVLLHKLYYYRLKVTIFSS